MNFQTVGGLMVQLAADVANLRKDMAEAEKVVDKGAMAMSKGMDLVKGAFIGLAGVMSVGAVVAWVKAAADAGDEMKVFSEKTGVAIEDVAGLQLAFKQGGVESAALQGAIAKMTKQMADGNEGFKKMGVETRNADGSLRNVKDVLGDVAQATKEMGASANTTALLQEVLGKSATALIPTLLGGRKGLEEMDEMARKLGLTMSQETAEAADKFNDTTELLGLGLTGVGRQVAAQLLPTLSNLAESFLESMTEGDRLKRIADGLGTVFKLLYTVVVSVVEIFATFGKLIGGTIARLMAEISGLGEAIVKVFKGDFKGAAESAQEGFKRSAQISKDMSEDIAQGWKSTGKAISTAWKDSSSASVTALAGLDEKTRQVTLQTKAQEEAAKKAAAEAAKQAAEVDKLTQGLDKQISTMNLEDQTQQKLTAGQKQALDVMLKIQDGTLKLTDEQKRNIVSKLEQILASEKHQQELAEETKWMAEAAKSNDAYSAALQKTTESIEAEVVKQRESNQMLGLSKEATAQLEIAKLQEQATAADRLATWAEENMLGSDLVEQYKKQATGLRELATLKGEKVHLEAAKEANEAWTKTTEEIGKSFTDSLFRAFEEGKSFGDAFMDSLKNLFKTTVLKLLIQPVQQGMNNVLGNIFGGGGGGGSSGGGGGFGSLGSYLGDGLSAFGNWMGEGSTIGGWANTAGSWLKSGSGTGTGIGSMFGTFGSAFSGGSALASAGMGGAALQGGWTAAMNGNVGQGLGQIGGVAGSVLGGFMAGRGVGQLVSGGYGIGGSGNSATNTGAAIGAAVGSIIPGLGTMIGGLIGGALGGLANRAFGHKAKEYNGEKGLEGTLSSMGVSGQTYAEWTQKGGWFRSDKHGTDRGALDEQTSKALAEGSKAVYTQTAEWAKALGLPAERLKNVTTQFKVKLTDNDAENTKALTEAYTRYATDLANSFANDLKPFQRAGEQVADTIQRLMIIKQFSEGINEFGGIFSRMANLSIDAKEQLIGLAGGLEAFIGKAQSFVDSYYTQGEKTGLAAGQLLDAFKAMGIDGGSLGSREDFRALVEAQQISTEEGRKAFAGLLDLGPVFAQVADYLKENNLTLEQAAQAAPQVEVLQAILKTQDTATQAQAQIADQAQAQLEATTTGTDNIVNAIGVVTTKIGELTATMLRWADTAMVRRNDEFYTNGAQP